MMQPQRIRYCNSLGRESNTSLHADLSILLFLHHDDRVAHAALLSF
jgi:hypothetical protein